MTTKSELEKLAERINDKLENNGSKIRVELRGAYGKVGLSSSGGGRNLTGLMTKKELAIYLRAVLDGLYMFN